MTTPSTLARIENVLLVLLKWAAVGAAAFSVLGFGMCLGGGSGGGSFGLVLMFLGFALWSAVMLLGGLYLLVSLVRWLTEPSD
jgi:hypothetical protein